MKTVTYNVLDYNEFEKLVKQHTGVQGFEPISAYEWNNYANYTKTAAAGPNYASWKPEASKEWIDGLYAEDLKEVDDWIAGNKDEGTPGASDILSWMCHKGFIEPGNYLITVFW